MTWWMGEMNTFLVEGTEQEAILAAGNECVTGCIVSKIDLN